MNLNKITKITKIDFYDTRLQNKITKIDFYVIPDYRKRQERPRLRGIGGMKIL